MNKSTHEDHPAISSSPSTSSSIPGKPAETLRQLSIKEEGIPAFMQTFEMLDELTVSPRASTIEAVMEYSRNRKEHVKR